MQLVEERSQFAKIVWIGQLANKIGCTDQTGLRVGLLVVLIIGNGKAG